MHEAILTRVLGRAFEGVMEDALLLDHARHRIIGVDYPAVVAEPGKQVRGTLCRGIMPRDLKRLDVFEGDEYERRWVDVRAASGLVRAQTYVFIADVSRLEPREWSFAEFEGEKLLHWTDPDSQEYEGLMDTTGGRNLGTFWQRNAIVDE